VRFFQAENLKDFTAEDLDELRKEIRTLKRELSAELLGRQRSCAHCGQRIGDCLRGAKYCSAWHKYLDAHRGRPTASRLQFECKRALHRLKALRQPAARSGGDAADPVADPATDPATASGMPAALRSMRIRRILKEFRSITGEALKSSLRALRASGTPGA
jgi:hypothetical protein